MNDVKKRLRSIGTVAALVAMAAAPTRAIEWKHYETAVRGYPVMRDAGGRRLADGTFIQWIAQDGLHVQITYASDAGRRFEETIVMRQRPELAQTGWRWRELEHGKPVRTFDMNFGTGLATATKVEKGETKHWSDTLDVSAGSTFAGFGFTMAAKALRERLINGEVVDLKAVGFTPQPKVVTVAMSYGGRDKVRMSGRAIDA